MKSIRLILCVLLFTLAFAVRLYGISNPLADWHSWRQSDTAAVARNFRKSGIDLLRPRYDDLSNIQSGKDNPEGYRMVEFPIYQAVGAVTSGLFPQVPIEQILRLISICFTAGSVVILYILLLRFVDFPTALLGGIFYAVLPFGIYYGRTILPDPMATFFALLSLQLLSINAVSTRRFIMIVCAGIAGAISLLIRPMAIFLLFPTAFLLWERGRLKLTVINMFLYGAIVVPPILLWRRWITFFPEGIPVSDWLYNKDNIRFKGAWFHWLFAKRLGELILGFWGLVPFVVGIIKKSHTKDTWFSMLWLSGLLAYFIIFAGGNVQHDYYQALMIPVIVWFTAKGAGYFLHPASSWNPLVSRVVIGVCLIFAWMFSWYTVRTYFWINRPEIVEAGRMADSILPKDAKVIAPYNGDTTFLYQTNRRGWPLGFDIDKKIAMGAQYYIGLKSTDDFWETDQLAQKYMVLMRNDTFAIIDLTQKK